MQMKKIIKYRWVIFAIWMIATIALTATQPDINAILRQKTQEGLNENSPSVMADSILSKMETSTGTNNLIVFYDKDKISDEEYNRIGEGIKAVRGSSSVLGIAEMIDPFSMPEAKGSLISEDGTTLMVSFKLDKGSQEVDDIKNAIDSKLSNVQAERYLTGEAFIANDYTKAAFSGVEKSAVLTVLFILIVLMLLFRSVITPLVSLAVVTFTYLCSMGITTHLVEKVNFPVTNLTQILLILILFGIGTDYNILLFNRFKEELSHGLSTDDAIIKTYKTAGKTIAYCILTVLIAFFSLVFSESPIYKSAIVIVIGAAILLLAIVTLTPIAMKVLGNKLFWPSKNTTGHKESKLWYKITSASIKHPAIALLIVTMIIGPTVYLNQQKLNFDSIAELGDDQPSKIGFNLVSDHFGRGQAMPVSIVIENGNALDNNESFTTIDNLTERLKKIEGVDQVASVTQPLGEQISNFYIGTQVEAVSGGLTKTQDGVNQIDDGLKQAADKLSSADFSQVNQLVDGTAQLHTGMAALSNGLQQIQMGISDGSSESQSISDGIAVMESSLAEMSSGVELLAGSYEQMQSGYSAMGAQYQGAAQALLDIKSNLTVMQVLVTDLGTTLPAAQSDPSYQVLTQTIDSSLGSLDGITPGGINALNENYDAATAGFTQANNNLMEISNGLAQLEAGLSQLESGLNKAGSGIGTIVTNMDTVTDGIGQLESGQQQLASGLTGFSTFGTQLSSVNTGLKQISSGLGKSSDFLSQLNTNKTFSIPNEALTDSGFKQALDTFMSSDRTITKMIIILKDDPYSAEASNTIKEINKALSSGLTGTSLSNASYGVAGPSAMMSDMNDVLSRDLNRMIVIVLVGVFLILLLVTRSFWTPVFITLSLMGSYYAAMFVLNFMSTKIMGLEGVSSYVPFFSFIIIVALGVDYSIFLMMRFKEYPGTSPNEAIVMAARDIGGVVTSAAIILGGTFATLIPSGLTLLSQLAIAVITGLIVLCLLMLPVFLPAMIAVQSSLTELLSKNKEKSKQEKWIDKPDKLLK
ncbi:MAG: MMPL family transporter [Acetobacterium sp.]|nr:MMPL family transporter [Acetobacterium sp.]